MSLIYYRDPKVNFEEPIEVAKRLYVPNIKILTNKFSPENDNFDYQAVWVCQNCFKFLAPADCFCRECDRLVGNDPESANAWLETMPKIVACLSCGFFLKLKTKRTLENSGYKSHIKDGKCGVFRTYMKDGVVRKKKNDKYEKSEYDYVELERDTKGLPLAFSKNVGIKSRLTNPYLMEKKRPSRSTSVESRPKRPKVQNTLKSPTPERRFKPDIDFINSITNKENDMSLLLNEDNFSHPPDIPNLSFNTSEVIDLANDFPDSAVTEIVTVKQEDQESIDIFQIHQMTNNPEPDLNVSEAGNSVSNNSRDPVLAIVTKSASSHAPDESDEEDHPFQIVDIEMPSTLPSDIKSEPEVEESPLIKLKLLLESYPSSQVYSSVISDEIYQKLKSDSDLARPLNYLARYMYINLDAIGSLSNSLLVYANTHQSEVPSLLEFFTSTCNDSRFWYDFFVKRMDKYLVCASSDNCAFENNKNCAACLDILRTRDIHRLQLAVSDRTSGFLAYFDSVIMMLHTYHK